MSDKVIALPGVKLPEQKANEISKERQNEIDTFKAALASLYENADKVHDYNLAVHLGDDPQDPDSMEMRCYYSTPNSVYFLSILAARADIMFKTFVMERTIPVETPQKEDT